MAVLVDSSIWIESAKPKSKTGRQLSRLMSDNIEVICVTEPIQVEVCQGARSQTEFEKLWDAFLGFQCLPVHAHHWELASWNYFRLRRQGITTSTIDCLIATVANAYHTPLWTLDSDFLKM